MSQHGSRRNLLDNQQTVNQKNKTMCKQLKKNFETTVRAERHRIPKILQQQVSQTCVKHGIHGLDGVQTEPGRETESVETNGRENWWPEGGTWTRAQVTNYCNGGVWGYFWWWSFRHWYIGGLCSHGGPCVCIRRIGNVSSISTRPVTVLGQTIVPLRHPLTKLKSKLGLTLTKAKPKDKTRISNLLCIPSWII